MTVMNTAIQAALDAKHKLDSKKNKPVFDAENDALALAPFIEEAVIVKEKIALYQGSLNDIKTRAKDELGIKPAQFNKILGLHFKRNRDEIEEQNEEIIKIYDNAFPNA